MPKRAARKVGERGGFIASLGRSDRHSKGVVPQTQRLVWACQRGVKGMSVWLRLTESTARTTAASTADRPPVPMPVPVPAVEAVAPPILPCKPLLTPARRAAGARRLAAQTREPRSGTLRAAPKLGKNAGGGKEVLALRPLRCQQCWRSGPCPRRRHIRTFHVYTCPAPSAALRSRWRRRRATTAAHSRRSSRRCVRGLRTFCIAASTSSSAQRAVCAWR